MLPGNKGLDRLGRVGYLMGSCNWDSNWAEVITFSVVGPLQLYDELKSGSALTSNKDTTISSPSHGSQLRLEISPASGFAMPLTKNMSAVWAKIRLQPCTLPGRNPCRSGKVDRALLSESNDPNPATVINPEAFL